MSKIICLRLCINIRMTLEWRVVSLALKAIYLCNKVTELNHIFRLGPKFIKNTKC